MNPETHARLQRRDARPTPRRQTRSSTRRWATRSRAANPRLSSMHNARDVSPRQVEPPVSSPPRALPWPLIQGDGGDRVRGFEGCARLTWTTHDVIVGTRALPDRRATAQPVHRRLRSRMQAARAGRPNRSVREVIEVVVECMGDFHPHGDASIYDALRCCWRSPSRHANRSSTA